MKKVVSNTGEVINFLVAGQRHSTNAVVYDIDAEGVMVKDAHAKVLEARLGGQITVSDIDVATAKKDVEKAIAEADKTVEEPKKAPAGKAPKSKQ